MVWGVWWCGVVVVVVVIVVVVAVVGVCAGPGGLWEESAPGPERRERDTARLRRSCWCWLTLTQARNGKRCGG